MSELGGECRVTSQPTPNPGPRTIQNPSCRFWHQAVKAETHRRTKAWPHASSEGGTRRPNSEVPLAPLDCRCPRKRSPLWGKQTYREKGLKLGQPHSGTGLQASQLGFHAPDLVLHPLGTVSFPTA
jgi:hypothetical protein